LGKTNFRQLDRLFHSFHYLIKHDQTRNKFCNNVQVTEVMKAVSEKKVGVHI